MTDPLPPPYNPEIMPPVFLPNPSPPPPQIIHVPNVQLIPQQPSYEPAPTQLTPNTVMTVNNTQDTTVFIAQNYGPDTLDRAYIPDPVIPTPWCDRECCWLTHCHWASYSLTLGLGALAILIAVLILMTVGADSASHFGTLWASVVLIIGGSGLVIIGIMFAMCTCCGWGGCC